MSTPATQKKHHKFKMPHVLFLVLILLFVLSALTYIIPAGQFGKYENGKLIGDQFEFLEQKTPVNFWQALLLILPGLQGSSKITSMILIAGGFTGTALSTGAFDTCIDYAVYKLKDKGVKILFPFMCVLFCFIGGFAGNDSFVAMLPIALAFVKRLRLDPLCACAIMLFSYHMGGMVSPEGTMFSQITMGITPYSGIGVRMAMWPMFCIVATLSVFRYANRISKDPSKSLMAAAEWYDNPENADVEIKEAKLEPRAVAVVLLFLAQPFISLFFVKTLNMGNQAQVAVMIVLTIVCGLIYRYSLDKIGAQFAKGCNSMGFLVVVIGMSAALSNVMTQGNIMHTIVYYACKPLQGLHKGFAAVGMSAVITLINVLIPSGSAKIAVLCPIITPMCEMLDLPLQIGVQALQFGDKLTNCISPMLGTTVAILATAKVPLNKWLRFILPRVLIMAVLAWVALVTLTQLGWA